MVDDVVDAAKQLVSWVETKRGAEGAPDTTQAIEAINAQVAIVEALLTHARATAVKAQLLADTARESAIEFHKRLVAFRRVLASVVGERSRDYQLLRYRRARRVSPRGSAHR